MRTALILALTLSTITAQAPEEIIERSGSQVSIEGSSSTVTIENASLGFDETATSVVKIVAHASEPVESFTARIRIYGARNRRGARPEGVVSRVLGPVGLEARSFEIPLTNYFIEDQRITVAVGSVQVGPSPKEGLCYNFCASERQSCRQDCGPGCISRFMCKISVSSCESDCQCKPTCP